jgi:hypothetical protein
MSNSTSNTTTTHPTADLIRFPLSTLRAGRPVLRAAEKCRGILRHPRSRVRVAPGWNAPYVHAVLPCGGTRVSVTVHMSRHRITPRMWEEFTGAPPVDPAVPLFFTTLSAQVPATATREAGVRDVTVGVHSLFRRILSRVDSPGSHDGPVWVRQERCATPSSDDPGTVEWVWHALLSQNDLESDGPVRGPHSSAA